MKRSDERSGPEQSPGLAAAVTVLLHRTAHHEPDRVRVLRRMGRGPDGRPTEQVPSPRRARLIAAATAAVAVVLAAGLVLIVGSDSGTVTALRPPPADGGSGASPAPAEVPGPGSSARPVTDAGRASTGGSAGGAGPTRGVAAGGGPGASGAAVPGRRPGDGAGGTTPDGSGAGSSGTGSTGAGGSGTGGSGTGGSGTGGSGAGGSGTGGSGAGGSGADGPAPGGSGQSRPQIRVGAGRGALTLPSGAVDWVLPGVRQDGALTRAKNPGVRLEYRAERSRGWRDGPVRASWSGGSPEQERTDAKGWVIIAADGGRVDITVPPLDRSRTLVLHIGGADAVVTAGGAREVAPGTTPGLVTVDLPPSSASVVVTLAPARSTRGSHIGLAAVELR